MGAVMSTYAEKLMDPRWQRKRLEAMELHGFLCCDCGDDRKTLHVHHIFYERGLDPWDYPADVLRVLCEDCHAKETRRKRAFDLALREFSLNGGDLDQLIGYVRVQSGSSEQPENFSQLEGAADALHITPEKAYEKIVRPTKAQEVG